MLATYANFVKPAFEEFCLPVSVQFFLFIIFLVDNIMLISLIFCKYAASFFLFYIINKTCFIYV